MWHFKQQYTAKDTILHTKFQLLIYYHFSHVRQGPAVVQVKMRNDDAVNVLCEVLSITRRGTSRSNGTRSDVGEVRKPAIVVVTHVHATVQHDVLATDGNQQTGATNILTSTQGCYLY